MKILHIIKAKQVSGAETHLKILLPALKNHGVKPALIVLIEKNQPMREFIDYFCSKGIFATAFNIKSNLNISLIIRLTRFIKHSRPDIVHTHLIHGDIYGGAAAFFSGVPCISTRHNTFTYAGNKQYAIWLSKLVSRYTRYIIAISKTVKQYHLNLTAPELPCEIVYYGLEFKKEFYKIESSDSFKKLKLILVGRLICAKRIDVLINALHLLKKENISFECKIVGQGEDLPALQQLVKEKNLAEEIEFAGYRKDVPSLLQNSDIFVLPSEHEGLGLAVLEAMYCGLAVLVSNIPAFKEYVTHEHTGLIHNVGDFKTLKEQILYLAKNRESIKKLGDKARDFVKTEFSVSKMVTKTLAVYNKVLSPGARNQHL